jgi:hypothetical protein
MSSNAVSSTSPARPVHPAGRRLTVASYVATALSFVAPFTLGAVAIVLGAMAASRGDRAGRTAVIVAGVVTTLEGLFVLLVFFGVIRIPGLFQFGPADS